MGEVGQTSEALGTKHLGVGRKGWKTLGCFDKENCGYDCVDDLVEMRGCHGEEIICFFLTKIELCHAIYCLVCCHQDRKYHLEKSNLLAVP